jgi:hypothetical protein
MISVGFWSQKSQFFLAWQNNYLILKIPFWQMEIISKIFQAMLLFPVPKKHFFENFYLFIFLWGKIQYVQ